MMADFGRGGAVLAAGVGEFREECWVSSGSLTKVPAIRN